MMKRIVLIGMLLPLLCTNSYAEEKKQLVDRVVAIVNNEPITQSEFDAVFRPIYEQVKTAYQGDELTRELNEIRQKLLNQIIEDKLVYQESKKLKIEVSDAEIQEELAEFKKQFPDEASFQRGLEQEGIGIKSVENRIRERIAIQKLHENVIRGRVIVSPKEVEKYYTEHPNEFKSKEQVELWMITIPKSDETAQAGLKDERAKKRAESVLSSLKHGSAFADMARKNSEDSHAEGGGYVGFVERGDLLPNIDKIIFSIPTGSLSEVLETERAYHIFKLGKKSPPRDKTLEETRNDISEFLFRQKAHERFLEWMEALKKKSFVSIR